jgi:lipoic acid synthetase
MRTADRPHRASTWSAFARAAGIRHVESGPLVRSSYHASGQAEIIRALADRR